MSPWGLLADILLGHSEALAVAGLGFYIAYEVRVGAIKEVRMNQRVIGIGVYRVIERDEELDEEAFAEALWGEEDEEILYRKLAEDT